MQENKPINKSLKPESGVPEMSYTKQAPHLLFELKIFSHVFTAAVCASSPPAGLPGFQGAPETLPPMEPARTMHHPPRQWGLGSQQLRSCPNLPTAEGASQDRAWGSGEPTVGICTESSEELWRKSSDLIIRTTLQNSWCGLHREQPSHASDPMRWLPVSALEGRWVATHIIDHEKKINPFSNWQGQKGDPWLTNIIGILDNSIH